MPYKSAKQRKFMHAKHPEIAARWDAEYGGKVKKSAWGVVEKLDQADVHVTRPLGTLRPVGKRRKRRKRPT